MSNQKLLSRDPTLEMIEAGAANLTRATDVGKHEARGRALDTWYSMFEVAPDWAQAAGGTVKARAILDLIAAARAVDAEYGGNLINGLAGAANALEAALGAADVIR